MLLSGSDLHLRSNQAANRKNCILLSVAVLQVLPVVWYN